MSIRLERIADLEALAFEAHYRPAAMAARAHTSLRQLERYTQDHFGVCLRTWIKVVRMRKAVYLLATGESIKMVAWELGYQQPSHFDRHFKEVFGVCPSQFEPPPEQFLQKCRVQI
jgi:AraC-like DNA-binding protein